MMLYFMKIFSLHSISNKAEKVDSFPDLLLPTSQYDVSSVASRDHTFEIFPNSVMDNLDLI